MSKRILAFSFFLIQSKIPIKYVSLCLFIFKFQSDLLFYVWYVCAWAWVHVEVRKQLVEVGLSPTNNLRQGHSSFCFLVYTRLATCELLGSPPVCAFHLLIGVLGLQMQANVFAYGLQGSNLCMSGLCK